MGSHDVYTRLAGDSADGLAPCVPSRYARTMRRTPTTLAVAVELLTGPDRPRWSYEIATKIGTDRGSVNAILQRMLKAGWLIEFWEGDDTVIGRPRRHLYRVSEIGEVEIRALIDRRPGTEVLNVIRSRVPVT